MLTSIWAATVFMLLAATAWATPDETPEAVAPEVLITQRWDDLWNLRIGDRAWLAEGAALVEDLAEWSFTEGFVFPVECGEDTRLVGFLYVGDGVLSLRFPDHGQAMAFANDMVMVLDRPEEELRPVLDGSPYPMDFTAALVLAADPMVPELLGQMRPVVADRRVLLEDVDETIVVVTDLEPLEQARREARRILTDRERRSRVLGTDLRASTRREVLRDEMDDAVPAALFVHTHTEHPFRHLLGFDERGDTTGRWLTYVRDESGVFDSGLRSQVVVQGSEQETERADLDAEESDPTPIARQIEDEPVPTPTLRTLVAQPFEGRKRIPPIRMKPIAGAGVVWIEEKGSGMTARMEVEAALTVRAEGGAFGTISLLIPRDAGRPWLGQPSLPDRWVLRSVTLEDGTPVTTLRVDESERRAERPGRRGCTEVLVVLPEPLADGDSVTLEVRYADEIRYAHVLISDAGSQSYGTTTGLVSVLPRLAGRPGAVYPVSLVVGVPLEGKYGVAASGTTEEEWTDAVGRYRKTATSSSEARVVVGRWPSTHLELAALGFPQIRVQLFAGDQRAAEDLPVRVRQVLNFYQGFMPTYPVREVDVLEVPTAGFNPDMEYGNGLVGMRTVLGGYEPSSRRDYPELEFVGLARALAQQWWLVQERHPGDAAVADAMSRSYASLFLLAGFGEKAHHSWRDTWTGCVRQREKRLPLSLTRSWSTLSAEMAAECVGPMVLGHMLRKAVGDRVYLEALNDVLRGQQPRTLDGIQAALEVRAERDLDDYFEFWVVGGHLPKVTLRYAIVPDRSMWRVVGHLQSDVPFGTFEVPILLKRSADLDQVHWVSIVDGEGHFDVISHIGKPRKVVLNPGHNTLLLADREQKVDPEELPAPAAEE
ncbi:MAG: hypothetical protein JRI25_17405 [Deltaproteobacteria bacterium]|nr:hypothetical protein [Deltaproteobacteria bacterium]